TSCTCSQAVAAGWSDFVHQGSSPTIAARVRLVADAEDRSMHRERPRSADSGPTRVLRNATPEFADVGLAVGKVPSCCRSLGERYPAWTSCRPGGYALGGLNLVRGPAALWTKGQSHLARTDSFRRSGCCLKASSRCASAAVPLTSLPRCSNAPA